MTDPKCELTHEIAQLGDSVGFALTGHRIPAGERPLAERLADSGWDLTRIVRFREERLAQGMPWPVPVPANLLPQGFAAHTAAVTTAINQLGLFAANALLIAKRPLNADEKRLTQERPPHWG